MLGGDGRASGEEASGVDDRVCGLWGGAQGGVQSHQSGKDYLVVCAQAKN